jgi:hypothetical protein
VAVLWDSRRQTIVNNESADLLQLFNRDLGTLATNDIDLRPATLEDEIARYRAAMPACSSGQAGLAIELPTFWFVARDRNHRFQLVRWLLPENTDPISL